MCGCAQNTQRTLVALSNSVLLSTKHRPLQAVTLKGTVIKSSGGMSGGLAGVESKARRWEEKNVETLRVKLSQLETKVRSCKANVLPSYVPLLSRPRPLSTTSAMLPVHTFHQMGAWGGCVSVVTVQYKAVVRKRLPDTSDDEAQVEGLRSICKNVSHDIEFEEVWATLLLLFCLPCEPQPSSSQLMLPPLLPFFPHQLTRAHTHSHTHAHWACSCRRIS